VRGHADTAGNIRCDEIATQMADGENISLYNGPLEKYPFSEIVKVTLAKKSCKIHFFVIRNSFRFGKVGE
jgi:hypothetical protein